MSQALLATVDNKVYMSPLFRALIDGQTPIVSVPVLQLVLSRPIAEVVNEAALVSLGNTGISVTNNTEYPTWSLLPLEPWQ